MKNEVKPENQDAVPRHARICSVVLFMMSVSQHAIGIWNRWKRLWRKRCLRLLAASMRNLV